MDQHAGLPWHSGQTAPADWARLEAALHRWRIMR